MPKTEKRKKEQKPEGDVVRFPARKDFDSVPREGVVDLLSSYGFEISPKLLPLLRIPPTMVRGNDEKMEFFDVLSIPPFPYRPEDSPSHCFDEGLDAPSWVKSRYLSIVGEKGSLKLVFIDTSRHIFLKEAITEQDRIASKLYEKVVRQPE